MISQMRREHDVQVIIRQGTLLRVKLNRLQHCVLVRIGHNLLFNAIPAIAAGIDQFESRHAVGQPFHFVAGIAFFLGKKLRAVGDDHSHVTDASLINARVINLIENSVAQCKPDPALVAQRRAHTGLGAGCPARGNSRTVWSETYGNFLNRSVGGWFGMISRLVP